MIDERTLKYSPTHEWVYVEGDVATVGISRFAVEQLTDLIVIDLPKTGTRVEAGKSFGEIESVKAVSDLYAPVDGEVVATNEAVARDVTILSEDPYTRGWLVKIRMSKPEQVEGLLEYPAYQEKIKDGAH
ncbi:MAG: glycine cleavage system H protein [Isosphaeraceae bacterium]|jgi:glycine cleavage system H protein|nr:MAG: glycine cleavage system H protein [Isosphaeraceae bacterium]